MCNKDESIVSGKFSKKHCKSVFYILVFLNVMIVYFKVE